MKLNFNHTRKDRWEARESEAPKSKSDSGSSKPYCPALKMTSVEAPEIYFWMLAGSRFLSVLLRGNRRRESLKPDPSYPPHPKISCRINSKPGWGWLTFFATPCTTDPSVNFIRPERDDEIPVYIWTKKDLQSIAWERKIIMPVWYGVIHRLISCPDVNRVRNRVSASFPFH